MKKTLIYLSASLLCLSSCYKDLGNYKYNEINEIIISSGEYTYITPKEGQTRTITIAPAVTQTMASDASNLCYEWKRKLGANLWEVVGDKPSYDLVVTPADVQDIVLRLAVTDVNLDITTYEEIVVTPIFAFNQCWFVLQDKGGQAVLGSVDGTGSGRVVTEDIYNFETGKSLSGAPVSLGFNPFLRTTGLLTDPMNPNYAILLGVFTQGGQYILNGSTLEDYSALSYTRMLYEKKAKGESAVAPGLMCGTKNGGFVVDNGKLWYAYPDEFALYYPVKFRPSEDASADTWNFNYNITGIADGYSRQSKTVVYDKLSNRFLFYYFNELGYTLAYYERESIVNNGGEKDDLYLTDARNCAGYLTTVGSNSHFNRFDPSNLVSGFNLDFMGMSAGQTYDNVLAVGHSGSTFHIYELCPAAMDGVANDLAYCSNYWQLSPEGDIASYGEKVPVATSNFFERMFFYAAGNKVYRVDLTVAVPTPVLVYESVDQNDKITMLKFKSDYNDIYKYDPASDLNLPVGVRRDLGLAVEHSDNTSSLVELKLTAAGEIEQNADKNPIVYSFDGLNKIVDMVFSFKN